MTERVLTRKGLLAAGGAAGATVLATAAPARAHGGDDDDDGIVGSWYGRVTADDPALGSFEELISFHPGGIVTDAHRSTPGERRSAHCWRPPAMAPGRAAGAATRRSFASCCSRRLPSAGAAVGTDNVRLIGMKLDRSGNRLYGPLRVHDPRHVRRGRLHRDRCLSPRSA